MTKPSGRCHQDCKPITAARECHCLKCHQSFYTVESFDIHRHDPDIPEDQENDCWMPEDCGLILESGMWATALEHSDRKFNEDRAEKARAARGK